MKVEEQGGPFQGTLQFTRVTRRGTLFYFSIAGGYDVGLIGDDVSSEPTNMIFIGSIEKIGRKWRANCRKKASSSIRKATRWLLVADSKQPIHVLYKMIDASNEASEPREQLADYAQRVWLGAPRLGGR